MAFPKLGTADQSAALNRISGAVPRRRQKEGEKPSFPYIYEKTALHKDIPEERLSLM